METYRGCPIEPRFFRKVNVISTSKFSESRYRVPRCCAMLRLCQLGAVAARRQRGAWQSSAWGFVTGDGGKKAAAYVDIIYASSRFGVKLSRNGLTIQPKKTGSGRTYLLKGHTWSLMLDALQTFMYGILVIILVYSLRSQFGGTMSGGRRMINSSKDFNWCQSTFNWCS